MVDERGRERSDDVLFSKDGEKNERQTLRSAFGRGSRTEVPPLANSAAKVDNADDICKELDKILAKIDESGSSIGAHELLFEIAKSFGFKGESLEDSKYYPLGRGMQFRVGDHYGSPGMHKQKGHPKENYGFVIKLSSSRFMDDSDVDYLECVYFPDKIKEPARQKEIIDGLKRYAQTGDFLEMAYPDKINASGKWKKFLPSGVGASAIRKTSTSLWWLGAISPLAS